MATCGTCGSENREGARFCDACGAPLAAERTRELRKVVTVLFCDVTSSTALGERLDPESLRRVMARYFEVASDVIERHGGTVEKFIGDAVMAVFGVPVVHEDDALRAVRAAADLQPALRELNTELEAAYGVRLALRTGLNTGEVVTGTAERLATGDAVNVAARLEQAAQPGEVVLGGDTVRLVKDAVDVEPLAPLDLKGKAKAVPAYRLVAVRPGDPADRRPTVAMVGRERQQRLLDDAFANVVGERSCHLFTVLGTAGVGKSRLVAEFLERLDTATVIGGRCLSYGEGISYWPVTAAVKELLGPAPGERLAELGLDPATASALAPILGQQTLASSPEEIAWAVRKLFETAAAERPLVVVFDDLHWGQPVFLDLVEHIADFSRNASILMICMARPELLDRRPAWGGGKLNAVNVLLEPLAPAETDRLIDELLSGEGIRQSLRDRILENAAGNPLFVGEMVAMLAETRDGNESTEVVVPPTIQALLASRLDQLDAAERGVLERGSVEGQVFHRGAVVALAPEEQQVDGRLMTLVRKDLVRPEQSMHAGDDAYRFRHLLIRDAAYEALPKATRAELHARFAAWLEDHAPQLVELDEVVGYHLEQSFRYRAELGALDEAVRSLAPRAAERLLAAAIRAGVRGDLAAAESLALRAVGLAEPGSASHREALLELSRVFQSRVDAERARDTLNELFAAAELAGDERSLYRARLIWIELMIEQDPTQTMDAGLAEAEEAARELERLGDDEGVAWALRLTGNFLDWSGRSTDADRAYVRALEYAERADSPAQVAEMLLWNAWSLWWGPIPADEGIERTSEIIERASGNPHIAAVAMVMRGCLKGMRGEFGEARSDVAAGRARLQEMNRASAWAGTAMVDADLELLAGDAAAAARALEAAYESMRSRAKTGYVATIVGFRAAASLDLGREDEALAFADETAKIAQPDDFEPLARQSCVRARVLARRGDHEGAAEAIKAAIALTESTEYPFLREYVAMSAAEVARLAGRLNEERAALEEALRLAELKGDVVTAAKARDVLAKNASVQRS
ncbi:MAG TPA: adenylate/guanylate cyclase domain-containing protein [Gaiellaceae bacterium]